MEFAALRIGGARYEDRSDVSAQLRALREQQFTACTRCQKTPPQVTLGTSSGWDGTRFTVTLCQRCSERENGQRDVAWRLRCVDSEIFDLERRELDEMEQWLHTLEVREAAGTLCGYAVTFDDDATFPDGHRECIAAGAFRDVLASGRPVQARVNHDRNRMIGNTADKSLTLREDAHGLWFELRPWNTPDGRAVLRDAARGEIRGVSISWFSHQSECRWSPPPMRLKTITCAALSEISIVTPGRQPRYARTWATLKTPDAVRRAVRLDMDARHRELDELEH